jgi:hypothetical protein
MVVIITLRRYTMRKAASQSYFYIKTAVLSSAIALLMSVTAPVVFSSTTVPISAKALDSHDCDSSEWHFVITQIDSEAQAPGQIQVSWADGGSEQVGSNKFTGKTAHYTTTSHLSSKVNSATANIYSGWSGQFNLSHGPCGGSSATPAPVVPTATPTVSATASPTASPTAVMTPAPTVASTPTVAPSTTTTSSSIVSNGLSDNLGCSVNDCSGNVVAHGGVVAGVMTELPSTGSYNVMPLVYALMTFIMGVTLVKIARYLETK